MTLIQNVLNSGTDIPKYHIPTLGVPSCGVSPMLEDVLLTVKSVHEEVPIARIDELYTLRPKPEKTESKHDMPN